MLPPASRGRPAGTSDFASEKLASALADIYRRHSGDTPARRVAQDRGSGRLEYGPFKDFVEQIVSVIPDPLRRSGSSGPKGIDHFVRRAVESMSGQSGAPSFILHKIPVRRCPIEAGCASVVSLLTTPDEKGQSPTPLSGHWPGCSPGRRRVTSSHRRQFWNPRRRATRIATLPGPQTPRPSRREQWLWRARRNPRAKPSGRSGASPSIWMFPRGPCTGGSTRAISWPIASAGRCGSRIMICEPFWHSTEIFKGCHILSSRVIT